MADEEQKYFSLTEAERLRAQLEPLLIEAMESRRKMNDVDRQLNALAEKIRHSGGLAVSYDKASKNRVERNRLEETVQSALDQIQDTGCVVKDLDVGLLDFPTLYRGQEVYLCWRMDETDIDFWHGTQEGFAGRKLIDSEFLSHHTGDSA